MSLKSLSRWITLPAIILAVLTVAAAAQNQYFVDALNGSDNGNGSVTAPWKTITHALQSATTPATINVLPGTYDVSNNKETFPLQLPANVSLIGTSPHYCIIDGEKPATNRLLEPNTNTVIQNLTVKNSNTGWWDSAIAAWTAYNNWKVLNCTITASARGIHVWDNNTNVLIAGNFFHGNNNDNISVFSSTNVDIFSNTIDGSLKGMILTSNTSPAPPTSGRIFNNCLTNATQFGIDADKATGALLTLDNNNLWKNATNYQTTVTPGKNDISADPKYVDAKAGNLHLAPASPLVDVGNGTNFLQTDWDGIPRPQGKGVDIGADEIVFEPTPAALADFHVWGQAAPGTFIDFVVLGKPSDGGAFALSLLEQKPPLPTPIGQLRISVVTLIFFLPIGLDANGVGKFSFLVPNTPAVIGLDVFSQGYSGKWLTVGQMINIR
jgi:hypothetical protein